MRRVRWAVCVATGALVVACSSGQPDGSTTPAPSVPPPGTPVACPSGSTPEVPGAASQARPDLVSWFQLAAMSPSDPAIVVGEQGLVPVGAGMWTLQSMWTFDVCTNTWDERGASSLPAADERPALGQLVHHEGAGVVLGLPVGLAPVWSYDAADDRWTPLSTTGGGGEAWPMAVYDPDADRLLAFAAHSGTVRAYDLATDAWSDVDAAGSSDASWDARPNAGMGQVDLAYDSVEHLLILVITRPGVMGGVVRRAGDPVGGSEFERSTLATDDVWAYDPRTNTWTLLLPASAAPASRGPG